MSIGDAGERTDLVWADCRGDEEGFGKVDDERLEGPVRTFDNCLCALNQINYVYTPAALAAGIMGNGSREPVAAGLDKVSLSQPGPLFAPLISACNFAHTVNQLVASVVLVSFPNKVGLGVPQVNWTRLAVEPGPIPVPDFERKNVVSGADLEDKAIAAGTVQGAGWNQEVVMRPRGKARDKLFVIEGRPAALSSLKRLKHGLE